ncbi:hypothetical protein ABZP36_009896 [Zizania latifolia]
MKLLLISSVAVAFLLLSSGTGAITADHGAVAVVGGMMLVRHIEDLSSLEMESAVAYPQRRVLQGGWNIHAALTANRPACTGPCPARGNSYTGRGCQNKYGCR